MRASSLLRAAQPLKVAIVGAGPSAFYSASRVLSHFPHEQHDPVEVHMFERLPVSHGLVRYGVAPDHPEVKNVEHKFMQVAQDPRFRFFGNVNVGEEDGKYPLAARIPLSDLCAHYSHVIFAYGSSSSRPLGIPGSAPGELEGVHSALDFVNWYNGHPIAHDTSLTSDLVAKFYLRSDAESMTVIGAGNVALDVARIVLRASCAGLNGIANTSTAREELAKTDVPEPVLAALSAARIRHVDLFARRGAAQVAFTNKELREMMAIPGIAFRPVDPEHLAEAKATVDQMEKRASADAEVKSEVRVRKRLLSLLEKGSQTKHDNNSGSKIWGLNFYRAPASIHGDASRRVREVLWNVTKPPGKTPVETPHTADKTAAWGNSPAPVVKATTTGDQQRTATDLIVSSIGYRSEPLEKDSCLLPFDVSRSVIPNDGGRVRNDAGEVVAGRYASGWVARGPVGVIASTMYDAYSVADLLVQDWKQGVSQNAAPEHGLPREMETSTRRIVGHKDWLRIDQVEVERGAKLGKAREKILTVREMLDVLD